jgi:hypothetical protein
VTFVRSARVTAAILESGSGFSGNGCVGAADSPSIELPGTGRSSTPNTGSPVSRLRTKTRPIFVSWMTAGTVEPFRVMSARIGCAGGS